MKKLLIVDGNSIINRAYYATETSFMKTAEGLYTGAVYGFLNIFLKYLEEDDPDYIAVCFDVKHPTFRHEEYEEYKATRKGMPDELAAQMPLLKELLHAFNVAVIEKMGYEADDLIGTFCEKASSKGMECIVLTGDRDSLQLVNERVVVKLPVTKGGRTSAEFYDVDKVYEKYGVTPSQLIDVKALMGDKSDNVPGIAGVGEKTALSLIKEFGSLDGIYENIDKISKPALKKKLEEGKNMAYLSRKLVTIMKEVPLEITEEDIKRKEYDPVRVLNVLNKLEFRSIIKRLKLDQVEPEADVVFETENIYKDIEEMTLPEEVVVLTGIDDIAKMQLPEKIDILYITYTLSNNELSEINFRFDNSSGGYTVALPGALFVPAFLDKFAAVFESESIKKVMFDAKPLILWLKQNGCDFKGLYCDVAVCAYLSDSNRKSNSITDVYRFYTSKEIKSGSLNELFALEEIQEYAFRKLEEDGQTKLFKDVELPLVSILADLEYTGFRVNPDILEAVGRDFEKRINELTGLIHSYAGKVFNINSPKQLGEVLFEDLKLESKKKTKTGYSTNVEVLEKLYDAHPIIPCIIEYRQNTKLKSTYIDGLLSAINHMTGRVHSSFNQMATATGRLSSTEPNLQNLPIKSEIGRHIRRAFEPRDENHILIDADYSQIELRVLAHISQDSTMIEAFRNNEDIHTVTATKVFNVGLEDVTYEMRSKAKAVNFGIIYGISEYGLSRDLNISFYEAKQLKTDYLKKYPGVDAYMKDIVESARKLGYVTTLMGRRRYLPELASSNSQIRSFGERIALNTPIQGTAADIIKIAMVKVYNELARRKLSSKLILQVHDELLIDALKEEKEEVIDLLKDCMENAFELSVPLVVSIDTGMNFDFNE
ncbi:MAG: DNA polymerase I [Clostridiaceae bacterium]|nr:DNA polymerase I [Clostridiaceae bacterium]